VSFPGTIDGAKGVEGYNGLAWEVVDLIEDASGGFLAIGTQPVSEAYAFGLRRDEGKEEN